MLRASIAVAALANLPALAAADLNKVLHVAFPVAETGFDPAKVSDGYSNAINENIFDALVTYDYLARPARLVPNAIEAMPTISGDGKVYTYRIRRGIFFADDPVFRGRMRELTAEDYVYSFKRFLDPTINSPYGFLMEGKFVGADELKAKAGKGALDYDTPIEGIKALDRYTLQLILKETNFNLDFILSMPTFGAVAREVIEAYKDNTMGHPVGTGPYVLKEWRPGARMVLEANPGYRKVVFDSRPGSDPIDAAVARDLKGRTLPVCGRVEVNVIEEEQPTWLAFLNRQLDTTGIPQVALQEALDIDPRNPSQATLKAKYAKEGLQLQRQKELEVTYTFFNMDDPVVGGESKPHIALRRAIAMAFPRAETIATIRRGQAVPMQYLIPEGVAGHNPAFRGAAEFNPAKANALLDQFGYRKGPDGWRTQPDGRPLSIEQWSTSTAVSKQWNEYWQKAFDSLKIHLTFQIAKWNETAKANREGKVQMWGLAWSADYPDGDNFMQLLYGPNSGESNSANFKDAQYDKLYAASLRLPDGPQRNRLYDEMNRIVVAQQPWIFGDTRIVNRLAQPYVRGWKVHPLMNIWRFIDIRK